MELHFFIIWSTGRLKEQEILDDLAKNFEILEILEIEWSKRKAFENFCRFYKASFNLTSIDIVGRGTQPFVLVTFLDTKPVSDVALTSSGYTCVNTRILNLKNKYRQWVGNEFSIHSSVTFNETRHDLVLLLGKNYQDYLEEFSTQKKRKGDRLRINKDLLGADRWDSVEEVFYLLNECVRYTLLRDFEVETSNLGKISDVDLLVDDRGLEEMPYLLNSKNYIDDTPGTFMCNVIVGRKLIPFHLHSFAYLTPKWVMDILKTRILNAASLYVPTLENQFFSLYYQLIHWKLITKQKYKDFLSKTYLNLFSDENIEQNQFDQYLPLLNSFISLKGYLPDVSSYLRQNPSEFLETVRENIEELGIKEIRPYRVDLWKPGKGVKLFTGQLESFGKVIIKYFGPQGILKKEFLILEFLKKMTDLNVPKPIFFRSMRSNHQMLVCEYLEASSVADLNFQTLDTHAKEKIVHGICNVIETYKTYGLIHRDIDPSNILINKKFDVYVIDYEYMIDTKKLIFDKNEDYFHSLESLYNLGLPNNLGVLKWNDAYSAIKVIKSFESDFEFKYPEIFRRLINLARDKEVTYSLSKRNFVFFKKKVKIKLSHLFEKISRLSVRITKRIYH